MDSNVSVSANDVELVLEEDIWQLVNFYHKHHNAACSKEEQISLNDALRLIIMDGLSRRENKKAVLEQKRIYIDAVYDRWKRAEITTDEAIQLTGYIQEQCFLPG